MINLNYNLFLNCSTSYFLHLRRNHVVEGKEKMSCAAAVRYSIFHFVFN